jgi:DNA-binding transcriptional regulator YiaG
MTALATSPATHAGELHGWPAVQVRTSATQVPAEKPQDLGTISGPYWDLVKHLLSRLFADQGTRVTPVSDLRALMTETKLDPTRITFEPQPTHAVPMTRMARIRNIAPLSLREWEEVFGVSHSAVRNWLRSEPDREKLTQVLESLEQAARYRGDVVPWLRQTLPGTTVTPLQLLARDNPRAFRGALRARASAPPQISPEELRQRRQADESWAEREVLPPPAPE